MNKRHFLEGLGSKRSGRHSALTEALKRQVGEAIFSGKVKPPKSKEQGDLDVLSKRPESIESGLRKDFGLKAARKKASGGNMKRSIY